MVKFSIEEVGKFVKCSGFNTFDMADRRNLPIISAGGTTVTLDILIRKLENSGFKGKI